MGFWAPRVPRRNIGEENKRQVPTPYIQYKYIPPNKSAELWAKTGLPGKIRLDLNEEMAPVCEKKVGNA